MAAISTAVKKNRPLGPQNEPVMVYFGTFGPLPIAAGNYHLWDVPPRVRFIDGYVEIDVAGGGAPGNSHLAVITNTFAGVVPAGSESIFGAIAAAAALTRFVAASTRVQVPFNDALRYVLAWCREAAATTNGETITVCMLAVRDDLT